MSKTIDFVTITVNDLKVDLTSSTSVLGKAKEHHVLMDVGATNCRIAIIPKGLKHLDAIRYVNFKANCSSAVKKGLENIVAAVGKQNLKKITSACGNTPAPVKGLVGGPLSNYEGPITEKMIDLAVMPVELFPRDHTIFLNDLEACAFGICAVGEMGIFPSLFSLMWPANPKSGTTPWKNELGEGHCVVIAPGTGLGAALIEWHARDKKYTVLPLEMGHLNVIDFPDTKEFIQEYAHELESKRGGQIVYDDICSGRGLERAYKYISKGQTLSAEEIGVGIAQKDSNALSAMRLYNQILMHFTNQMSMGFQPRSIIVCGDNTVRNTSFYDCPENIEFLKKEYNRHCMESVGFMSKVHLVRQTHDANMNILGCAYMAGKLIASKNSI